jgi:hypothetical protein
VRRAAGSALLVLSIAAAAPAQEAADPHAAQPERPTVATHAFTVAPGYAELEFGVEFDALGDARAFLTPTTVKLGLGARTQLEANLAWLRLADSGVASGVGDLVLAFKWRLADSLPVLGAFAVQPAIRVPSGAPGVSVNATVGSLLLISSHRFGATSVDLNLGWFSKLSSGGDYPISGTVWTISAGTSVAGALGWTLECFGFPGTHGAGGAPPLVALLTGPTYTLEDWLVLDAGTIVPIAGPQAHALYVGVTWNLGRVWAAAPTAPSP